MKLDEVVYLSKARALARGAALMIISGYSGELEVTDDLTSHWIPGSSPLFPYATVHVSYELVLQVPQPFRLIQ